VPVLARYNLSPPALPLEGGEVFRPFGIIEIEGQKYFHRGIDIKAPARSPVRAAWGGQVIRVGEDPLLGKVVEIDHGQGITSLYGRLGEVKVAKGQKVERGQEIGSLKGERDSYLHFEIKERRESPGSPALFASLRKAVK